MLTVKGQAGPAQQESSVAVVGRGGVEDEVDAGDHFGWVPGVRKRELLVLGILTVVVVVIGFGGCDAWQLPPG